MLNTMVYFDVFFFRSSLQNSFFVHFSHKESVPPPPSCKPCFHPPQYATSAEKSHLAWFIRCAPRWRGLAPRSGSPNWGSPVLAQRPCRGSSSNYLLAYQVFAVLEATTRIICALGAIFDILPTCWESPQGTQGKHWPQASVCPT